MWRLEESDRLQRHGEGHHRVEPLHGARHRRRGRRAMGDPGVVRAVRSPTVPLGFVARPQAFSDLRARSEVSIVIFDSRVAVGSARAVYMSVRAEELSGAELERDFALFDAASHAQGLTRRWALEDVQLRRRIGSIGRRCPSIGSSIQTAVPTTAPTSRSRQYDRRARRCAWHPEVAQRTSHLPNGAARDRATRTSPSRHYRTALRGRKPALSLLEPENEKAPPRGAFPVRPRGLEPPRTNQSTRPSTLRVYQFRHRRVGRASIDASRWPGWGSSACVRP